MSSLIWKHAGNCIGYPLQPELLATNPMQHKAEQMPSLCCLLMSVVLLNSAQLSCVH